MRSDLSEVISAVGEDDLTPPEKETTIIFSKDQSTYQFFTAEAGLMRRVLHHPEATDYILHVVRDNAPSQNIPLTGYQSGEVVGVRAVLPITTLTIGAKPRSVKRHSNVISQQVMRP